MSSDGGIVLGSERELSDWIHQTMVDPGFCARELLGYNYDIDHTTGRRINVGTGGVRACEPYLTMTRKLSGRKPDGDLDTEAKKLIMILASRGGLKSSAAAGGVVSHLIGNPEDSILYMSRTDPQVKNKSLSIRNVFARNREIHRFFGLEGLDEEGRAPKSRKGGVVRQMRGNPWNVHEWTLGIRERIDTQNPTFKTGSLKRIPTGGHYNLVVLDDLIDHENCRNADQLELSKLIVQLIMPLRLPGSRVWVLGTVYHPLDLYAHIETLDGWDITKIGCGFEIEVVGDKEFRLKGTPTFPHLTKDYLLEQLRTMNLVDFSAQYLMRHENVALHVFHRKWFKPIRFEPWMSTDMTVWILTDIATSMKKGACMSVVLVVGVDRARRIYVMDGAAGRMEGGEIIETLFTFYDRWSRKCTFGGVTMENVAATQMFGSFLDQEQRKRGIRLNVRMVRRGTSLGEKDRRISALEPTARAGNVHVCSDTFPKTYTLDGKTRQFYDPVGHLDTSDGSRQPSGDLVEQFVMHPAPDPKHKDIADCLADIDQEIRGGEKLCYWRPPSVHRRPVTSGSSSQTPLDRNGSNRFDWLRGR